MLHFFKIVAPELIMPSQKKRIALTVEPELDATLEALAHLQNKPKTAVIMEFLESVHPAMIQLQKALEDVRDKKSPNAALSALFANLTGEYASIASEHSQMLQEDKKHD